MGARVWKYLLLTFKNTTQRQSSGRKRELNKGQSSGLDECHSANFSWKKKNNNNNFKKISVCVWCFWFGGKSIHSTLPIIRFEIYRERQTGSWMIWGSPSASQLYLVPAPPPSITSYHNTRRKMRKSVSGHRCRASCDTRQIRWRVMGARVWKYWSWMIHTCIQPSRRKKEKRQF